MDLRVLDQEDTLSLQLYLATRAGDFTILFEEAFFVLLPGELILLVCLLLALANKLRGRDAATATELRERRNSLSKSLLHGVHICLRVAFLVTWQVLRAPNTRCTVAAAVVSVLCAVACAGLSYRTHRFRIRPCSVLLCYLSVSVVADAVRLRTLWTVRQYYYVALPMLLVATLATECALVMLEARRLPKGTRRNHDDTGGPAPQDLNSVYSQRLFFWLNGLVLHGYRHCLALQDLYPMDKQMKQKAVMARLKDTLPGSGDDLVPSEGAVSATKLLVWALGWSFIRPIIPRLLQIVFVISQPLLLQKLSEFLDKDPTDPSAPNELGLPIVAAYAAAYLGIAISAGWYWHWVDRSVIQTRGLLIGVIYRRVLALDAAGGGAAHGDDDGKGRVVTLVSGDVEKAVAGLESCHELWANALQAAVALWLLHRALGLVFLAPLAVAAAAGLLSFVIARAARKRQAPCMAAMESRLDATVSMVQNMGSLRMMGSLGSIAAHVQGWRTKEIGLLRHYRWMTIAAVVVSFVPTIVTPAVVFTAVDLADRATMADVSRVFAALGFLSLLCQPLIYLYQLAPFLAFTFVCLGRVGDFLSGPNYRAKPSMVSSSPTSPVSASFGLSIDDDKGPQDRPILRLRNARFGWSPVDSSALVHVDSVNLGPGQLLVVTGPAGSGKTTLLLGILGETPVGEAEELSVDRTSLGFCSQTPWLPARQTVRQLVVGAHEFDSAWYATVTTACGLDVAPSSLSAKDGTAVGSTGATLSQGQRQLVALARAVYSRKTLLLLDDPLSDLDQSMRALVCANLLGPKGLLRDDQHMVVITSSAGDLLSFASQVMRLGDQDSTSETYSQSLGPSAATMTAKAPSSLDEFDGAENQLSEAEEAAKEHADMLQISEWAILKYYFRAAGLKWVVPFSAASVAFSLLHRFMDIVLRWWCMEASGGLDAQGPNMRMAEYWLLGVFSLFSLAISTWVLLQRCVPTAGANLHRRLLDALCQAPFGIIAKTDSGSIVNRFTQDFNIIDGELTRHLSNVVQEFVSSMTQLAIVVAANGYFTFVVFGTALVLYLIQRLYLRTARQLRLLELSSRAALCSHMLETLDGLVTLRAFRSEAAARDAADALIEDTQRPVYLFACLKRWLALVLDLCVAAIVVIVVGTAVATRGRSDTGFVAVALINLMGLGAAMRDFVMAWTDLGTAMGSLGRIKHASEVLWAAPPGHPSTAAEPSPASPGESSPVPSLLEGQSADVKVAIEFRNVTASHFQGGHPVLKDFSLVIEAGQKVTLSGASGSGKRAVLLAISGMLHISEGSIHILGKDIRTLALHELHGLVGVVPEDPPVVPGITIREHVNPKKQAGDSEIVGRMGQVGLWTGLLDSKGLDEQLTPCLLSRDQLQRLALVAALLKRPKVLLIDTGVFDGDDGDSDDLISLIKHEADGMTIVKASLSGRSGLEGSQVVQL